MHSIELLRDNLRKSRDRVLARIEEMREHCVVFPTPKGGCHTLWVLGHLACIEGPVVCRLSLQYLADHWYMHRGQLADARRAAGLGRNWV